MSKMKISSMESGHGTLFTIEDTQGHVVVLSASEAKVALQFLYEELDTLTRQANELPYEPNWKTRQQMGEHPFVDWPSPGLDNAPPDES